MNDALVNKLQFFIALAALGVLGWGYRLAQRGKEHRDRALRDRLFLVLGLLGALAYPNFGWLHFGNFVHTWDTYHYYLGSKYFPELEYDRLYECTAVADDEDGLGEQVRKRAITDLRTNARVKTDEVLAHPETCKSHFTADRWAEFRHDVAWFRPRVVRERWEMMGHDHGYNATPVWNMLGHALSSLAPASDLQLGLLALLDPLLLSAMAALLYWAFGWRVLALAMLVLGTNYANRWFWTGGAFLRHDWLFFSVASVCLLKKERPLLAGLSLAYAATLRLFPALLLVGPFLAAIEILRTERRLDRRYLKLFGGAALGVAVLLPASFVLSGGLDTYQRFFQNTSKHASTPLTNHMGLRTAVAYRPSTRSALLHDNHAADPWGKWKEERLRTFHEAMPLFIAAVLGFLALLFFAVKGAGLEPWAAAALSTLMIGVGVELTSYYYCFLVAFAPLFVKRREVGMVLLGFTALTQFIGWSPLPGMSQWDDEKYTSMSFAVLITFAVIAWTFTRDGAKFCLPAEAVPDGGPSGGSPGKGRKKGRGMRR